MRKFLMGLILATALVSSFALAQSVPLVHGGKEGVWLPLEMSAQILADVKASDLLRLEVGELKLQLSTRLERVEVLKEAVRQSEIAETRERQLRTFAIAERDKARKDLKRWYRHPLFLILVGVVGTVVLEVAAVKIITASKD